MQQVGDVENERVDGDLTGAPPHSPQSQSQQQAQGSFQSMGDEEGSRQSGMGDEEQNLEIQVQRTEQATQTGGQQEEGMGGTTGGVWALEGSDLEDSSEQGSHEGSPGDDWSGGSVDDEQGMDWEEFLSVSNEEQEAEEEGAAPDSEPKAGTGKWYANRLSTPVYTGCNLLLLQVVFFMLAWRSKFGISREAMDVLLKFLSHLLPVDSIFPGSLALMRAALGVRDWSSYERHVCARDGCPGYSWKYVPRKKWYAHKDDTCPHCGGPRFEAFVQSGKEVLEPFFWYIDFKVEEVVKEDFFANEEWYAAYERASREEKPGSYYGSPEHKRLRSIFNELCKNMRAGDFDSKHTGHWEIITDAGQPWKSVAYSTLLFGLRCVLSVFDKCKNFNFQPFIIIPGPSNPSNLAPYLMRSLEVFERFGLRRRGILLPQHSTASPAGDEEELGLHSNELVRVQDTPPKHHRLAIVGK